jgi:hypothetical protein
VNVTGTISKQKNPNGALFYQLTTDGGSEMAITMTESRSQADDGKALGPFVGKKVVADGLIQKSRGALFAFKVALAE